jgi:hypothetical protein
MQHSPMRGTGERGREEHLHSECTAEVPHQRGVSAESCRLEQNQTSQKDKSRTSYCGRESPEKILSDDGAGRVFVPGTRSVLWER